MDLITLEAQPLGLPVPSFISKEGEKSSWRFIEFFTTQIRNKNTRIAYMHAVRKFFKWCERNRLSLLQVRAFHVASYIEAHEESPPTVKQHLAAIKQLFDYLVVGQIIPMNPASSVRGPKYAVKKGKTPVLAGEDARLLLDSIDSATVIGARDKALIGIMIYSFARVSAVLSMRVSDYYQNGRRFWIRLHEKGGKYHEVPVHHKAEEYLEHYLSVSGIKDDKSGPLFRATQGRSQVLKRKPLHRFNAIQMVKRRAKRARVSEEICCHTFRATGITAYLAHGGTIENAQHIAAHESPRTTKLYDRRQEGISLDEIERIII